MLLVTSASSSKVAVLGSRPYSAISMWSAATTWSFPGRPTHRWIPNAGQQLHAYCIEANSHITAPRRYLSTYGQLLEHAPYCERDAMKSGASSRSQRRLPAWMLECQSAALEGEEAPKWKRIREDSMWESICTDAGR